MEMMEKIEKNKEIISELRPFEGELLARVKQFYRIGLTWSSNALEGNSLTESETKVLLEDGLTIGGKPLRDIYEATGHSDAFDFMFSLISSETVDERDIIEIHRLFYQRMDSENAGIYRNVPVIISGSNYTVSKVENIRDEMKNYCKLLGDEKSLNTFEFVSKVHTEFVFIHPFIDGNGRVARLLMNLFLIRGGFLPIAIPPVLRNEYISLLELAHIDDRKFTDFIIERELETQKEFLRLMNI